MTASIVTLVTLKYGNLVDMYDQWMSGEIDLEDYEIEVLANFMDTTVSLLKTTRANH